MSSLFERYQREVRPELQKQLGLRNALAVPRIVKIIVNAGINVNAAKDPKFQETVRATLGRITGQSSVFTRARISVSSFKIRKGQVVGCVVTLRSARMWHFFEKLITIVLPRTRDFWGIPLSSVDARGNLSVGMKEHLAFPEIRPDEVERVHGLEVTIVTNAKNRDDAVALYRALGVPFKQ
jgi:large subunit ribosomal protein L5